MIASDFINDIPVETAHQAHSGTSFSPEKRAAQERQGYAEQLAADYECLLKCTAGKPGMAEVLDAEFARYREGYRARTLKLLHSQGRCVSWMISGRRGQCSFNRHIPKASRSYFQNGVTLTCKNTGKVFRSISSACRFFSVSPETIKNYRGHMERDGIEYMLKRLRTPRHARKVGEGKG